MIEFLAIVCLLFGIAVGYFIGAMDLAKENRKLKHIIELQDRIHKQAVNDGGQMHS